MTIMKISSLLYYADHGHLGLPGSAREYTWKPSQVIRLFASLYRGFPVGGFIFWSPAAGTAPQEPESVKDTQPAEFIVDGQQRATAIYGGVRGRPAPFRPGTIWLLPPLHFHLEAQAFAFYRPEMEGDPLWINLPDFFNPAEPWIGNAIGRIYETPAGRAHCEDYARRLNQLGGILDRNIAVEYLPGEASDAEAVEIYHLANGGGDRR